MTIEWKSRWECRLSVTGGIKKYFSADRNYELQPYHMSVFGTPSQRYGPTKQSVWSVSVDGEPSVALNSLLGALLAVKDEFSGFLQREGLSADLTLVEYTSAGDIGTIVPRRLYSKLDAVGVDTQCVFPPFGDIRETLVLVARPFPSAIALR